MCPAISFTNVKLLSVARLCGFLLFDIIRRKSFTQKACAMALSYKKLWKLLIDRDMTRSDLRDAIGFSTATMAKMSKGEAVGTSILERICDMMNCNIGDIVDYVPETAKTECRPRHSVTQSFDMVRRPKRKTL